MDLQRKSEIAVMSVRSITEHTDESVEARVAALEPVIDLVDRLRMRKAENSAKSFWSRFVAFFKRSSK